MMVPRITPAMAERIVGTMRLNDSYLVRPEWLRAIHKAALAADRRLVAHRCIHKRVILYRVKRVALDCLVPGRRLGRWGRAAA